jgi:hypothetical protein
LFLGLTYKFERVKDISMFQRFLQKIKKAWTLIKPALGHLATLITILGIGFIGIISPLTQSIEPLRIV